MWAEGGMLKNCSPCYVPVNLKLLAAQLFVVFNCLWTTI